MADNNEFKGYALVEVMGRQEHVGFVTTETYGSAVLFRIDQPELPECEETTVRPGHVYLGDGTTIYAPAGSVVKRAGVPAASVLVGSSSIYRITPCDEASVMAKLKQSRREPLMVVKLAENPVAELPRPTSEFDEDELDDRDSLL